MKRTLYFAFLALALGSIAVAQDGRGRNKQDQKSDPPKQEQRRETPPPPQRREEQRPPEQKRETPPPPQRREEQRAPEQKRETPPPPQRREEQRAPEQKRETPPPPQRREENRTPERNSPPPPKREEQNRDRDRNTPPPPKREEQNRAPERNTPPPQRQDDNGRGKPRQDQPRQDRSTPPPQQRGDQSRDRTPERNVPPDQRGTNPGSRRPDVSPGQRTPTDPGNSRGVGATHNRPIQRNEPRQVFTPPPTVVNSKVTRGAWREDRTVRTVPYRSGYYHYRDDWRDSSFCYPHYVFDYTDHCAPSPWYWYPHLPAYVSVGRCRPTVTVVFDFGWGSRYDYRPYYYTTFEPSRLDVAADRMEEAFRNREFRRLSYLVDRDDWVQIQVENADTYDLRGDDFADMMQDLIEETHTISYKITDVHSWRDGASVTARHTYVDSWGRREVVEHRYGFRLTREGYRIVSFRTDHF